MKRIVNLPAVSPVVTVAPAHAATRKAPRHYPARLSDLTATGVRQYVSIRDINDGAAQLNSTPQPFIDQEICDTIKLGQIVNIVI